MNAVLKFGCAVVIALTGYWALAVLHERAAARNAEQETIRLAALTTGSPQSPSPKKAYLGRFNDVVAKMRIPLARCSFSPPIPGISGQMYGCIRGEGETAKLFVNEGLDGNVVSVEVIWNDWWKDIGNGVHTDGEYISNLIAAVSEVYPAMPFEVALRSFHADRNIELSTDPALSAAYTYTRGPSIDERMLVVTAR